MSELIEWRDNWEAALAEAKAAQRPLLLEIYLEGCPHCRRLAQETHGDAAVAAAVNQRFLPVRLEGRQHMDLVQKLGVRGAPTTLLFSPQGEERHRFSGFYPPSEYLKELEKSG
ncbi:MAG: thioredoxin family protein [Thermodesulfobacteriota bacterium]